MMDSYHKVVGKTELFADAPPLAEVVLEVIGEEKIIFAEAFKPGATWWHSEGRKARRGLVRENLSDYYCAASRELRAPMRNVLKQKQHEWDILHSGNEAMAITVNSVSREQMVEWKDRLSKEKSNMILPAPDPMLEEHFISVINPMTNDKWIRINTAGRIKFSESLMLRYEGMKVGVAMSMTGTLRIAEDDLGRIMNERGYISARRLASKVDFDDRCSVLVALEEREDGCLYGRVALKE